MRVIWPLVIVVQLNEYVRILVYGYLPRNKRTYEPCACAAYITCNNCAYNSTEQAAATF